MLEGMLSLISIFFPSGLLESMQESKTLAVMIFIGTVTFGCFIYFLFKMGST